MMNDDDDAEENDDDDEMRGACEGRDLAGGV